MAADALNLAGGTAKSRIWDAVARATGRTSENHPPTLSKNTPEWQELSVRFTA